MERTIAINLATLERALTKMLAHVRKMKGETVEVRDGLYWFVSRDDLMNVDRPPTQLSLGAVLDDWQAMQRLAKDGEDAIGYDMVWAATILRALGDSVP